MDYQQQIDEKRKKLEVLFNEQLKLTKHIALIAKKSKCKRASTAICRALKVVSLIAQIRQIEVQKRIIASQPIFKDKTSYFYKGLPIINETISYVTTHHP